MALPTFTISQIADQLTTGYWVSSGEAPRKFADTVINYDLSGLPEAQKAVARLAFKTWDDVLALTFVEGGGPIDIIVDDNSPGAVTDYQLSGGTILSARIDIGPNFIAQNGPGQYDYTFQTYVHEIGHAIGLGHAGNYNGNAVYGLDNHYANDSVALTVMSYFDQQEAGAGSLATVMTPQLADILAAQRLYGAGSARTENTVYGYGTNAGPQYLLNNGAPPLFQVNYVTAFTIYDTGGIDTINAQADASSVINLNPNTFSSIHGLINNVSIAAGTIIEVAQGGFGTDIITGNTANNILQGNGGADQISGGDGDDYIDGGTGADTLNGGAHNDVILGAGDSDTLNGDAGNDFLYGGAGSDILNGGDGNDNINCQDSDAGDTANGGNNEDFIYGSAFADTLSGGAGYDNIEGGDGADTMYGDGETDFLYGQGGDDSLYGGAAQDYLYGGIGRDLLAGEDGADFMYGESGDDTLSGGAEGDYLWGGQGFDFLFGGAGNDFILATGELDGDHAVGDQGDDYLLLGDGRDFGFGERGSDVIMSGGGDDTLDGGEGQDYLWGGAGSDRFTLTGFQQNEVIFDFTAGVDKIQIVSSMYANYAAVAAGHIGYDSASNTTVVLSPDSSTVMILVNFNVANLDANSFAFV